MGAFPITPTRNCPHAQASEPVPTTTEVAELESRVLQLQQDNERLVKVTHIYIYIIYIYTALFLTWIVALLFMSLIIRPPFPNLESELNRNYEYALTNMANVTLVRMRHSIQSYLYTSIYKTIALHPRPSGARGK